ncbi:MAG: HEAT repeat domain-containing protein [Planctomycetota bacterium]
MMRAATILAAVLLAWPALCSAGPAELPAFPGAEGYGARAAGGRGGQVIRVTTLKPRGPGSLQAACDAKGPRIVVFAVSGVIRGDIRVRHGRITIAGQTAPGAGITIDGRLRCRDMNDAIIRFLRVRPTRGGGDAIGIYRSDDVIVDHVSACWGGDETLSPTVCRNVTVQWCAIEESTIGWEGCMYYGLLHNYAMLVGYSDKPATLHHNLFAHHTTRTPLAGVDLDYRNNVVYNVYGGVDWHPKRFNKRAPGKPFRFNAVGNYLKAGPGAPHFRDGPLVMKYSKPAVRCAVPRISSRSAAMYADGNYLAHRGGYVDLKGDAARPWPMPEVTTHTAERAYAFVLALAGCLPRDAVGRRTVCEVRTGTGSWGALKPGDLMAGLEPGKPPADADKDGMPDDWEAKHELDPRDPADAGKIVPKGASKDDRHAGYTYVEFYANECADELVAEAMGRAQTEKESGEAYKPPPAPDLSQLTIPRPRAAEKGNAPGLRIDWHDVPALVKVLDGAISEEGRLTKKGLYACRALGALGADAGKAAPALLDLIAGLTEKRRELGKGMNVVVTRHVTTALAHVGEPALPHLLKALDHRAAWVRASAAQALSIIVPDEPGYSEKLLALVDDKDGDVRADALCALTRIGRTEKKYVEAYARHVDDENPRARRMAAEALGVAGPAAAPAVPALVKGLADGGEVNTRFASARALGRVGPAAASAVPALVKALGDRDRRVRRHAAQTLARLGEKSVDGLIRGLGDAGPGVRAGCAHVLGALGTDAKSAAARLMERAGDDDAHVRMAAVGAMAEVAPGADAVRAPLVKSLGDRAWPVRWAAARKLGRVEGLREPPAALRAAANDKRREVAEAANAAIQAIQERTD